MTCVDNLAVIINVDTRVFATLALLSTLRYADMPVVVVDCESSDGSYEHFQELQRRYDFELLTAPRLPHGQALDRLFRCLDARNILLVDSDLELRSGEVIELFRNYIDDANVFGCGFSNGPGWLPATVPGLAGALFFERLWIPLVLLKRAAIVDALDNGRSFLFTAVDNEYTVIPPLAKLRSRSRVARRALRRGPRGLRESVQGVKPATVCYDTGAKIFEYLRYQRHMSFVGLPYGAHRRYTTHFSGVTRLSQDKSNIDTSGAQQSTNVARQRLLEEYGEDVPLTPDDGSS